MDYGGGADTHRHPHGQMAHPVPSRPGTASAWPRATSSNAAGAVTERGLASRSGPTRSAGMGNVRSRLDASVRRGLSPFVGRDARLRSLHQELRMATRGHSRVVAIPPAAGAGRSRLIYELSCSGRRDWLFLRDDRHALWQASIPTDLEAAGGRSTGVGSAQAAFGEKVCRRLGRSARSRPAAVSVSDAPGCFGRRCGAAGRSLRRGAPGSWRCAGCSSRSLLRPVCVIVGICWIDSGLKPFGSGRGLPSARMLL
jgi:hypothetical protein